jgi:hypothetical protein
MLYYTYFYVTMIQQHYGLYLSYHIFIITCPLFVMGHSFVLSHPIY